MGTTSGRLSERRGRVEAAPGKEAGREEAGVMMVLTKRQRIVVLIASILIGATGLYPPWRGIEKTGTYQTVTEYSWITSPPQLPWFLEQSNTLSNLMDPELAKYLDPAKWAWQIDILRLGVQWLTVVLVGGGLILIFNKGRL